MQATTTIRRRHRRLALVCLAGVLLAGCGADQADDSPVDREFAQADEGGVDGVDIGAEDPPAAEAQGGAGDEAVAPETVAPGAASARQRISRATIALSSDDPDQAVDDLDAAVRDAGGLVAAAELRRDELDLLRGSITFRVPTDRFDRLLADLQERLEPEEFDRVDEDVTGQVADVESRLRNLRALEEELLVLLTEAREGGDVDDVLAVFDRVGQVREEVEVLQGRRDELGDQVAQSTLTVRVEPSPALVESRTSEPDDDLPLPWSPRNVAASAVDATVGALQSFVEAVIRIVVFVVPVLVVWLSPLWVALVLYRWWRRRRDRGAGTAGTSGSADDPAVPDAPVVPTDGDASDPSDREVDDDDRDDHHGGARPGDPVVASANADRSTT